eukprot:365736-Chlamydomonas_euryale.AAC.5
MPRPDAGAGTQPRTHDHCSSAMITEQTSPKPAIAMAPWPPHHPGPSDKVTTASSGAVSLGDKRGQRDGKDYLSS